MDTRDKKCRISSHSTFKPPPRVTLTDQKKEAWLKDLASPSVPLRKLSRTIPHGIRNRTLLEQCCSKAIPISRAVWFARCVGANELRGLKRKGHAGTTAMAAECGWIRDWTEDVVNFIEKIVRDFDATHKPTSAATTNQHQNNWKFKIEYITRLLAHLFHEDLLDRQLVLKWSLRFFQQSKPEELPVALVYIKMLWSYLSTSRVLSQTLARGLLNQYSALTSSKGLDPDTFSPIIEKVSECMKQLFTTRPDSFVIPEHWRALGPVLSEAIKADSSPVIEESLQNIRVRNESLIVSDASVVRSQRNHRARFVKQLDNLKAPFNFHSFSKSIRTLGLKEDETLQILFNWATSVNRAHEDKIYLCLALCRYWRDEFNWDISASFQYFLVHIQDFSSFAMKELFDLVTEFLEYDLLLLESYFRGLISSGLLFVKRLRHSSEGHIALLSNLPLSKYPTEFKNQQAMLLRGLGRTDIQTEHENLEKAQALVKIRLSFLFSDNQEPVNNNGDDDDNLDLPLDEVEVLDNLLKDSKMNLCELLLRAFETKLNDSSGVDKISHFQFGLLQRMVLILRSPQTLYSMIKLVIPKVNSGPFLYFLANTIRDKFDLFSTFADVSYLVELLVIQYKGLKIKPSMSKGLVDLLNFTIANFDGMMKPDLKMELEQLLKPSSNPSPMDISKLSPVSESIASDGTQPSASSPGYDDVDELLLSQIGISGNTNVDSGSIAKYFEPTSTMFLDTCKSTDTDTDNTRQLIRVFQHLRDADYYVFTDCLVKWLRDQVEPELLQSNGDIFLKVLVLLVIYECITIEKVADIFMQLKSVRPSPDGVSTTRVMLDLISSNDLSSLIKLKALEETALGFQRKAFTQIHYKVFLKYIFQGLMEISTHSEEDITENWYNTSVKRFLIWVSNHDSDMFINCVVNPVIETKDKKSVEVLRKLLDGLIRSADSELTTDSVSEEEPIGSLIRLFEAANVYNLSLCQIQMRVLLQSLQLSEPEESDFYSESQIINFLLKGASKTGKYSISKQTVGDLMIYLPKSLKGQLLHSVELYFLQSSDFPKVNLDEESVSDNSVDVLFEIVDAIADCATEDITANTTLDIHKNLSQLITLSEECNNGEDDEKGEDKANIDVKASLDSRENMDVDDENEGKEENTQNSRLSSNDIKDGIKLFVKIVMIQCQSYPPDSKLRERLVKGLLLLLETPLVYSASEINGLLVDTLNAIRGALSDLSGNEAHSGSGYTPNAAHGRKFLSPYTQNHDSKHNSSLNQVGNMVPSAAVSLNDINTKDDTSYLSDLMVYDKSSESYKELAVRSFDLLEDPNPTMSINDVPLNLSMFDSSIIKSNPS